MITRLKLVLPKSEYDALTRLAAVELRNPHDQVRHLLRRELERAGLLGEGNSAPELVAQTADMAKGSGEVNCDARA